MKKKSFYKDLIRTIYKSKARFLSILVIIAVGVGFYAGINATEPDMILSADSYYKNNNLSDFRILSPLGFNEEDIRKVTQIEDIESIQESYSKDLFLTSPEGSTSIVRLYSYNEKYYRDGRGQNIPVIIEGKLPEKSGEIAVEYSINMPEDIKLNSDIVLTVPEDTDLSDYLKTDKFKVVGFIESPIYISFERGRTNIGDGSVDLFAYIWEEDFAMDKATDLYIKTAESSNLTAYSNEYKEYLKPIKTSLENLGKEVMALKIQELKDELQDAKKELEENRSKAISELDDAEQKLLDAENDIKEGEQELIKNETEYTKELDEQEAELRKARTELEEGKALYEENYNKWLEGYNEYIEAEKELRAAKAQLDEVSPTMSQMESELPANKEKLDNARVQLELLLKSIQGLEEIEQDMIANPPSNMQEFSMLIERIRVYSPEAAEMITNNIKIDNMSSGTAPGNMFPQTETVESQAMENQAARLAIILKSIVTDMKGKYEEAEKEYEEGLAGYHKGMKALEEYKKGLAEYETGLEQLNAAKLSLDNGKAELEKAKAEIEASEAKIAEGESSIMEARQELNKSITEGREELEKARNDLKEGRKEYEEKKADAMKEIQDAEKEIQDAEKQILDIPKEWFVFDRDDNPGYSEYGDNARRIGAVAKVFPLFFFLVAALVCLTTMTRMVEEERTEIGTYKALGYSTLTIASKYLTYALLSSLVGSLVGLRVGFWLFPNAIMDAYGIMYNIPVKITPYHADYAVTSIFLAVTTTVSASLLATLQELRAVPAALIQPKAPKPGKRIFLERITPIWKRLSFSNKITARNIFRYKQRFFMTVIGISGCTALLVTGFGLKNSINDIMDIQFDEIFTYSGQVILDTDKVTQEISESDLSKILGGNSEVESYIRLYSENGEAFTKNSGRSYEVNIMVPEDADHFKNFINLRERDSKNEIGLASDSAVITEKLSGLLNLEVGDTLIFKDSQNLTYKIKVGAIAENYFSHYIFISPEYFDTIRIRDLLYNSGVFNLINPETLDEQSFKEELMRYDGVLGVMLTEGIADEVKDTMESLDYVVMILILSAGTLAFVVLYNLTNINITERIREIATIKVLGFRDNEVSAYVYRENMILSVIGTLVGLLLGVLLHKYVIFTMEIDSIMFGRNVHLSSYIYSIILTMIFSMLVNLLMYNKLKNINMVESLKSVE